MSPSPAPTPSQDVGRAVRYRRRELKLTQRDLADLAGCGLAFLYELEQGKPTIRLDKLVDVLRVLGLELVLQHGKSALVVHSSVSAPEAASSRK
jgi:y4mF family transcriptional regulator